MKTVRCTIHIDRPPCDVFGLLTDYMCDHRWMVGVVGTDRLTPGNMRQGTEMICKFGIGRLTTMRAQAVIDVFDPGRRFVRRRVGGAMAMKGEFVVDPDARGSVVSWTMEVGIHAPSIGIVVDPLIGRWMEMSMSVSLRRLKTLAESLHVKEPANA